MPVAAALRSGIARRVDLEARRRSPSLSPRCTHIVRVATETSARRLRPSREISHASSLPNRPLSRSEIDARYANSKHGSAHCQVQHPSAPSNRSVRAGRSFESGFIYLCRIGWRMKKSPLARRSLPPPHNVNVRKSGNSRKRACEERSISRLRRRVIRLNTVTTINTPHTNTHKRMYAKAKRSAAR